MKPPYTITNDILTLCTDITLLLGKYEGLRVPVPKPELRKHTKIITIQSSLAIEGNTLSVDQVTDIINHKKVVGPKKDILEVKNAIKVYGMLDEFEPENLASLLKAHKILMDGLIKDAGKIRSGNVGVRAGDQIVHMAPKHTILPQLMDDLFAFLKKEKDVHPLIKSSVFHYEFEFIHPFMDGNGRIGRLWQSVILYNYRKIFEYIPVETVVRRRQIEYYEALEKSTKNGDSTAFIHFMLETIKEATIAFTKELKPVKQSTELRIETARNHFKNNSFSRKDYLQLHTNISTATASRDLGMATANGILQRIGTKAKTIYNFE